MGDGAIKMAALACWLWRARCRTAAAREGDLNEDERVAYGKVASHRFTKYVNIYSLTIAKKCI